jgi:hypothetical protein
MYIKYRSQADNFTDVEAQDWWGFNRCEKKQCLISVREKLWETSH